MAFQCIRYRMKAKYPMTCVTINFPLEKQYFWTSCLSSSRKWLKIQIFTMFVISLISKNTQDYWLMAFSVGFWIFICKTQALQSLCRYKFDFLTRSWWPVDLIRHSNDNFCHWKTAILHQFLTDDAVFDHFKLK